VRWQGANLLRRSTVLLDQTTVLGLELGNATRVPENPGNPPVFKPVNPGLFAVKNPGFTGLI